LDGGVPLLDKSTILAFVWRDRKTTKYLIQDS